MKSILFWGGTLEKRKNKKQKQPGYSGILHYGRYGRVLADTKRGHLYWLRKRILMLTAPKKLLNKLETQASQPEQVWNHCSNIDEFDCSQYTPMNSFFGFKPSTKNVHQKKQIPAKRLEELRNQKRNSLRPGGTKTPSFPTRTPKGMLFGGFLLHKTNQKTFLWVFWYMFLCISQIPRHLSARTPNWQPGNLGQKPWEPLGLQRSLG